MPGGNRPPYQQICNGQAPCGKGSIFQYGRPADKKIPNYNNVTTTADPLTGDPVTPFELWADNGDGGDCRRNNCRTGDPGDEPCGQWIGVVLPWQINPTNPGTNTFNPSGYTDFSKCFKAGFKNVQAHRLWHGAFAWTSGDALLAGNCPDHICTSGTNPNWLSYQSTPDQTKFRSVTYDKSFHNTFEDGSTDDGSLIGVRTVNANSGEITSTVISTETHVDGAHGYTIFYTNGGAGFTADPDTGAHLTDFTHGGATKFDGDFTDAYCGYPLYRADAAFDLPNFIAAWNAVHSTQMPVITDPNNYSCSVSSTDDSVVETATATFSRGSTAVSWSFYTDTDDGLGGGPTSTWSHTGTIGLSNSNTSSSVYADVTENLLSLWPLDDDVLYPWRTDVRVSISPLVSRLEVSNNVNPCGFNPYTVDDLSDPIDDALGNAPFSVGWTPTYGQRSWFDPGIYQWQFPAGHSSGDSAASALVKMFDGSIRGAPNPSGYNDYFDFYFNDWVGCCFTDPDTESLSWDWYILGYGLWLSAFNGKARAQLPMNATQWVDFYESSNKTQGAYLFYNDQSEVSFPSDCPPPGDIAVANNNDGLWACKYAEILDPWYSQNFARPAGLDKFSFDETQVYCAANLSGSGSGSTWTITSFDTSTPADGTDFSGYWGGPVVGGFYDVSSYSGGVLTLGSLVYNVPSGWTSAASGDDTGSCFGKLRFPTCPALLGRASGTYSGTTFTFDPAQPTFGMSPAGTEQVDIFDSAMTSLASNVTATRVDDSHFTTASGYPTAAWVMIHGAPAWYMSDDSPKGWYGLLEWLSDFRSAAEAARLSGTTDCSGSPVTSPTTNAGGGPLSNLFASFSQTNDCLPFERCSPRVVCISPNGETWENGITYPFLETFNFDEIYGSKWWAWVQATMTDLFWQTPHIPCGFVNPDADPPESVRWQADNGLCNDDFDETLDSGATLHHKIYRNPPQVEPRFAVPCTYGYAQDECAPSLPAGIQIGWSSPVTATSGDIAFPPVPPGIDDSGAPNGANTAFLLHDFLCLVISDGGCRFNYQLPACGPPF